MKYIFIVLLTIATVFGQSKIDSLTNKSQSIENRNQNLRKDIDSLQALRDSLQQKLRTELRDLYIMKYGQDAGSKVAMGQIWTGMSEEMMRDSWGKPDSIAVNKQKWGTYTQWYYGDIIYFFKDGKLFEWESPKE